MNGEWKELTRSIWEPMRKEWLKELQEKDAMIRERDDTIRKLKQRLRDNGIDPENSGRQGDRSSSSRDFAS